MADDGNNNDETVYKNDGVIDSDELDEPSGAGDDYNEDADVVNLPDSRVHPPVEDGRHDVPLTISPDVDDDEVEYNPRNH